MIVLLINPHCFLARTIILWLIVSTNSDTFLPSKFAVKPKCKNHRNEFEYRAFKQQRNDGKGRENVTIKMDSFKLFRVYSNSLEMANVSEFP